MKYYQSWGHAKKQTVKAVKPNTWGQPKYVVIRRGEDTLKVNRNEIMSLVLSLLAVGKLK